MMRLYTGPYKRYSPFSGCFLRRSEGWDRVWQEPTDHKLVRHSVALLLWSCLPVGENGSNRQAGFWLRGAAVRECEDRELVAQKMDAVRRLQRFRPRPGVLSPPRSYVIVFSIQCLLVVYLFHVCRPFPLTSRGLSDGPEW